MSSNAEEDVMPVYAGITATCARFGVSRTYLLNLRRKGVIETRSLAKKVLVKQASLLALIESLPSNAKREQEVSLARGTALSHERSIKRKRRLQAW